MSNFKVITADPAWSFSDKLPGKSRGAENNYQCMTLQDIKDFPLLPHDKDCYLFLWRVSAMVEEAYEVCRAWGFAPKSEIVWQKLTKNGKHWFGMGRHVRASHETCIVATKGRPKPKVRNIRSTFSASVGRHSEKPEEFYDIVEKMCEGSYLELFARRHRPGWVCLGNELEQPKKTREDFLKFSKSLPEWPASIMAVPGDCQTGVLESLLNEQIRKGLE